MITEDYVSFETAKLLKEKNFNEYCKSVYYAGSVCSVVSLGYIVEEKQNSDFRKYDNAISAPTLQMAMKWLREVHKLHIWFGFNATKGLPWYYEIHSIRDGRVKHIGDIVCGSYEQASEAAIKYCLENLI